MARILKKGFSHWPFDVDFWDDIKIRKLIKYQGGKAPQVFILLLCYIYKDGYYIKWDKELPFIIADKLGSGYDEAYVLEVINTCLAIGLLEESYKDEVLTSTAIQKRYIDISESLRRKGQIAEFNLLNVAKTPINAEETDDNAAICTTIELNRIEENRIEENRTTGNGNNDMVAAEESATTTKAKKTLAERKQDFYDSLIPYVTSGKYEPTMVRKFFDFWSEVSDGGRKMKWEKVRDQKNGTWNLAGRLAKWKSNGYDDKKTKGMTIIDAAEAIAEAVMQNDNEVLDMNKLLE